MEIGNYGETNKILPNPLNMIFFISILLKDDLYKNCIV